MTNEEFIQSIALEGEEWKTIPNWDRYAVSTYGRIAALSVPYLQGNFSCMRKQKLLKARFVKGNPGYWGVVLTDGKGGKRAFLVHRLVALTFIPNPDNLPLINHKDENSSNNKVTNLEWCTQQYNCNYGSHNRRMAATISKMAYQRRKVVQLSLSGDFVAQFDCIKDAASSANVSRSSVSLCCRGKKPFLCGHKWMYLEDYESLNQ